MQFKTGVLKYDVNLDRFYVTDLHKPFTGCVLSILTHPYQEDEIADSCIIGEQVKYDTYKIGDKFYAKIITPKLHFELFYNNNI
jgi:hypothetical protein